VEGGIPRRSRQARPTRHERARVSDSGEWMEG
jgi:hypothetical protein